MTPKAAVPKKRKRSGSLPRAGRSSRSPAAQAFDPTELLLMGAGGLGLVFFALGSLPGPTMSFLPQGPPKWWLFTLMFLGGLVFLFLFFRRLPEPKHPRPELPRAWAWGWLALILALAAFLRLATFTEPPTMYWHDFALSILDARAVLEMGVYHMLFPAGDRPPLYQYFITLVCFLLPKASSVTVQNISFAILDLIGIWILYLLGKEAGGRRAGLILAACVAFSKPRMVLCMVQQPCLMGSPAVEAALLFTLRLWKRPDRKRFLEWGAVLAVALYCYQSARPFIGFFPLAVLAGLWWRSDRRPVLASEKILTLTLALIWTGLFLRVNQFLPPITGLNGSWALPEIAALAVSLYLVARFAVGFKRGSPSLYWAEALMLAAILMYPIASQARFAAHTTALSTLHDGGTLRVDAGVVATLWKQFVNTLSTFAISGWDHPYMSIPGETFFDFPSLVFVTLGLAYLAARPDGLKGFVFLCVLVGLTPHALSGDPHSGKLQGTVGPLLLLASLALERVLSFFDTWSKGQWKKAASGVMVALLLSAGVWMYHRFYVWLPRHASPDRVIWQLAREDRAAGRRLFLHASSFFFSHGATAALPCESMRMGFIRTRARVLWLSPQEPVPDVAIYVSGKEKDLLGKLREEYPQATRQAVPVYPDQSSDTPTLQRIVIPGRWIPEAGEEKEPSRFIEVRRAPETHWRRWIYAGGAGLGRGLVEYEDRVADLYAPLRNPGGATDPLSREGFSGVAEGTMEVSVPGKYVFRSNDENYVILDVDGRRILDLRPRFGSLRGQAEVFLEPGEHRIHLTTFFRHGERWPVMTVSLPDGTEKMLSDPLFSGN